MNYLKEVMEDRRSIRRFLNKQVEWEKVVNLLHAGNSAPTEGNLQARKFIVTKDEGIISKISKACYNQMWINQASYVIVVVGEIKKSNKFYERGEFYNTLSSGACVQNILLKAHSIGLGACWVSAFEEEKINDVLSIKSPNKPMAVIPIGYPAETPVKPKKEDLFDQTFINSWGQKVHDLDLKYQNFRYLERSLSIFEKILNWLNNIPNYLKNFFNNFNK